MLVVAILWFNEISFLQMFQTALSFEPSCLWICHQPSQARRFSSKQNGLYSIQFLSSSRTRSVNRFSKFLRITRILAFLFLSEIPKKVFHGSVFKFHGNRDIKNLKDQDLDYLVWAMLSIWRKLISGLLGLNHVAFQENICSDCQYVTMRSWKILLKQVWAAYLHLVVFIIFVLYLILTSFFLFRLATWLLRTLLFKKIVK